MRFNISIRFQNSLTEQSLLLTAGKYTKKGQNHLTAHKLGMDALVDAHDNQEVNLNNYLIMDFNQRLTISMDEFHATKNRDRAKRLMHLAKLCFSDADFGTLYYEGLPINKNEIAAMGTGGYISTSTNLVIILVWERHTLAAALGNEACRRLHHNK